jgi:LmbE family N-acetylglucosaminyl deacetylase
VESDTPNVAAPRWPAPRPRDDVLQPAGPCRVLGIFAHPDDETFCAGGTFARYAEQGAEIMVVTATRGQAGQIRDAAAADRRTLPAVREAELRLACDRLGISTVRCLDHVDGTLADVELSALVDEVAGVIGEFRPDVVITFGPDGGYGHPDHVAISAATTAACRRAAGAGHDPSWPLQGPPRLYYRHFPPTDLLLLERLATWLTSRPNRFAGSPAFGYAVLLLAEAAHTLGHIRDHVEVRWFPPGSYVMEQGEVAGELFMILSGTADVRHDGGHRQLLGVGESFGYGHPGADVVAAGSLTCLVLSPTRPTAFAGRGRGARLTGGPQQASPAAGDAKGILSTDVSEQVMRKIGALSAYRSQFSLEPDMFPEFLLRDIFGREYFVAATAVSCSRPGPASGLLGLRSRDEGSVPDGLGDGVGEGEHRRPLRRRDHPLLVGRVKSVEPDQQVVVHDSARPRDPRHP